MFNFNCKTFLIVTLAISAGLFLVQGRSREELMRGCVDFIDSYHTFKNTYVLVLLFLGNECRQAVYKIKPIYPIADEYLENGKSDFKTKVQYCRRMAPIMADHEYAMECLKNVSDSVRG